MRLTKYDVFLKVIECGSFSAAAEQLSYSQSAVSQLIAALEGEMGVTLLLRGKAGVKLSADGQACLPYITAIGNAERALESKLSDLKGAVTGKVRIGSITSVSCHILPPVLATFRKQHPRVSFELRQGDYRQIETWLLDGTVDLGFLRLPVTPKLEAFPFLHDEMVAILPAGHPGLEMPSFSVARLAEEPFILPEEGYNEDLKRYFQENGVSPTVAFRASDDYTIMSFVESGMGIGILPKMVLRRTSYHVVPRPLSPPHWRELGIACPSRKNLSAAAGKLLEAFLAEMGGPDAPKP